MVDEATQRLTILLQAKDRDFQRAIERNNKLMAQVTKQMQGGLDGVSKSFSGVSKSAKDSATVFEREMGRADDAVDRLLDAMNPLRKAARDLASDEARLNRALREGTISAKEHGRAMEFVQGRYKAAEAAADTLAVAQARASRSHRQGAAGGFQNFSYQAQDVLVQVSSGTDLARALSQQAPQMLSGFGAIGPAAGLASAALIPLAALVLKHIQDTETLADKMKALEKVTDEYAQAAKLAETPLDELRAKYGDLADEIDRANKSKRDLLGITLSAATDASVDKFAERFGGFAGPAPGMELNGRRDMDASGAWTQFGLTVQKIADDLKITEEQAVAVALAFEAIGKAKGTEEQSARISDLRGVLENLAGGADKARRRFGGLLSGIDTLMSGIGESAAAAMDPAERAFNESLSKIGERAAEIGRLTEQRAFAHQKWTDAVRAGDDAAAEDARSVVDAMDAEIAKLTDKQARVDALKEKVAALNDTARRLALDPNGQVKSQASDLAREVNAAALNVDGLNNTTLDALESRFSRLVGMARALGTAANEAGIAASGDNFDRIRGQMGGYQPYGAEMDVAKTVSEAAKRGILDLIGAAEGTDKGRGYNETLGYGAYTGGQVNLVNMTLREVLALQRQMLAHPDNHFNSSAVGRYQIVASTLGGKAKDGSGGLIKSLGLSLDDLFTPALQDRMAMELIRERGSSVSGVRGTWEGFKAKNVPAELIQQALGAQSIDRMDPEVQRDLDTKAKQQKADYDALIETRKKFGEQVRANILDLDFERSILGKNAEEQEYLRTKHYLMQDALRRGVELNSEFEQSGRTVAEMIEEQAVKARDNATAKEAMAIADRRASEAAEDAAKKQAFFNDLQGQMKDGLIDAIVAGDSFAETLRNVAQALAKAALQAALFGEGPMAQGGGGGLLGGAFGFLFGGGVRGNDALSQALRNTGAFGGFRAAGGPIDSGRAYVVGERGPEIIVSRSAGEVIPNHRLGSGSMTAPFAPNITVTPGVTQADLANAMSAARQEYERNFVPMLKRKFPEYQTRAAV